MSNVKTFVERSNPTAREAALDDLRADGQSALPSRTDVASRACRVRKVPGSGNQIGRCSPAAADPLQHLDSANAAGLMLVLADEQFTVNARRSP
jgi:hypothetical protein